MLQTLRMALDRYDRHFPFFDGTVKAPPGVSLTAFQVGQTVQLRDGEYRHERMLHDGEFEVAEFSFSSFLMAIDRGLDIVGVPVFPRRLFSPGLFYVRDDGQIRTVGDLIGRRVGLNSFQTTLSVLARGDIKRVYKTNWEEIIWCASNPEKVPFETKRGVQTVDLPRGSDLTVMLREGAIDAFIHPHPPHAVMEKGSGIARLFADPAGEEKRYWSESGFFPIMHVIAMRRSLVKKWPELPEIVIDLFERANKIARSYFDDPNWSTLLWARLAYEDQLRSLHRDPWANGIEANEKNINVFVAYMRDQGLISRNLEIPELFAARG